MSKLKKNPYCVIEERAWHWDLDLQYCETSASHIINQYHTAGLVYIDQYVTDGPV